MKGFIQALATAAALLMVTASADAQPRPRYQERGDDRYHRFGRGTLDRVRADLNHAQRSLHYITPPDMRRFMEAREGLANFQRSWERGRYNRPELDQAIFNLHALVERGRLRPGDRAMLANDLRMLRELHRNIERPYRR